MSQKSKKIVISALALACNKHKSKILGVYTYYISLKRYNVILPCSDLNCTRNAVCARYVPATIEPQRKS